MKVYICRHCGNIVMKIEDSKVPVVCCGEAMEELVAGSVEAASEKHIPVIAKDGEKITVEIGEVAHPMVEEHYIKWVILETETGFLLEYLKPGMTPKVEFHTTENVKCVYAYCNLHGLWKKEQ